MSNKIYFGIAENETCNRNGCNGKMVAVRRGDGCSCHIHPPCSYCVYSESICNKCDHNTNDPDPIEVLKEPKVWYVYQTFDDVPEKDIKLFLTKDEAYELAWSKKRSIYTHWHSAPMRLTFIDWVKNLDKVWN